MSLSPETLREMLGNLEKENGRLRAEVAALQKNCEVIAVRYDELVETCAGVTDGLRRDLNEARALLARWLNCWKAPQNPPAEETSAFLVRTDSPLPVHRETGGAND